MRAFPFVWAAREDLRVPYHRPEPSETSAARPFLIMKRERGNVTVWALGEDRFEVRAPHVSQEVGGYEPAMDLAHWFAQSLGPAISPTEL